MTALSDLFIAKGNVGEDAGLRDEGSQQPAAADGPTASSRKRARQAGVASFATSRGAALADFNLDGLLDLVVVNRWESAQLWRNTSTERRPLDRGQAAAARPEPRCDRRLARGAGADQPVMRREITVGGGHASGQNGWWHFGLGDSPQGRGARASGRTAAAAIGKPSTATIFTYWSAASRPQLWTPK